MPEPAAAKIARGETRPSRVNYREPQARAAAPRMPADMDDAAKAVWRRVMRDAPPGLIRSAHADVLRCFCEAMSSYVKAQRALAGSALLVRGRAGLVKNPLHQVVRDNRDQVRLLARELGLSPAAAAAMQIEVGPLTGPSVDDTLGPPARLRVLAGGGDG